MQHELQHGAIRAFYQADGEWNRKFKLVYHKNKFLTPAIYELEKILGNYEAKMEEAILAGNLVEASRIRAEKEDAGLCPVLLLSEE